MSDAEYLRLRADQEFKAAVLAPNRRVRDIHLELADAYSFRLRETQAVKKRAQIELTE